MSEDNGRDKQDVGASASRPGCEASPSAASGVFAESHPSRVAGYRLAAAVRMADEISERLRTQIADAAARIAKDAESPLLATYLAGRTAELHDWAVRLNAWRTIADAMRDTDRSGEADETAKQAQPEARAGAEGIAKNPTNSTPSDRPRGV